MASSRGLGAEAGEKGLAVVRRRARTRCILADSEVRVVPVSVSLRRLPLRGLLFVLLLLSGLIPLVVVDYLLVSVAPRDGRLLETAAIITGTALLLVALAWILSGWAADAIVEPVRRLSSALARLAGGRFEAWVSPSGAVRELAWLSEDLNRMSARTQETVRRLKQKERDSETLATDAMRLFKQAVQAKEPLTKHHPGLLEAYSRAVARQLGDHASDFEPSELSLSPFTDPEQGASEKRDRRLQPRYGIGDLMVKAPAGARIVDIGSAGMGLETMEKLPLGRQDIFEFAVRSRQLRIPARVAWCRVVRTVRTANGDRVPVYRAGVRFGASFSIGDRDELLEIIQTHRHVA
jgi:hypothetical protein